ncbi:MULTISPECIES: hypothetical protein [Winslowiella]|uniref:hypothetical protein n=1 Tax=Winslowiella TaxID=2997349 RepID=UPI0028BDE1AD|nr:hypothetical protein [Winslowiella toletana]WNN46349.1 hypothetical protein RIN69_11100 [Winslowiella toletana]
MENNKRYMFSLCLMMAPLFSYAATTIDDLQYIATGTAGTPVSGDCTASLDHTTGDLGQINLSQTLLLANPFTLQVNCDSPQLVKFKFVDNSATVNPENGAYVLNDTDGGVISKLVEFKGVTAKADNNNVTLYHDAFDNGSNFNPVTYLVKIGAVYFGDRTTPRKDYQVKVGQIAFRNLTDIVAPVTEKNVIVSGNFIIQYGF